MKYADVNKLFTMKVMDYVSNSWVINSGTMGGSQGEIAKVDLTDGKKVIRIKLESISSLKSPFHREGLSITVGQCPDNYIQPNSDYRFWHTIWNGDLQEIERTTFYPAGNSYIHDSDWWVSEEEAKRNYKKSDLRYKARWSPNSSYLPDKANKIVLDYVRRKPRCKSARPADIRVMRSGGNFIVCYKDHCWTLK